MLRRNILKDLNLPRIIIAEISTISVDFPVPLLPDHFVAIAVITIPVLAVLPLVTIRQRQRGRFIGTGAWKATKVSRVITLRQGWASWGKKIGKGATSRKALEGGASVIKIV